LFIIVTIVVVIVVIKPWVHVKEDYFEIISKLFQCFISHVTTLETEIKLFQSLKESMLKNIHELH